MLYGNHMWGRRQEDKSVYQINQIKQAKVRLLCKPPTETEGTTVCRFYFFKYVVPLFSHAHSSLNLEVTRCKQNPGFPHHIQSQ